MKRPSPLWLVLALTGLACAPKSKTYGPPQDADTSGIASGGGGGAGGVGGSGGTGGTVEGVDCNSPGVDPLCSELEPIAAQGTNGPVPSQCHCQDEAARLLKLLACNAKTHYDTFKDSCTTAIPVPALPPAQTYYVPIVSTGSDFDTGDPDNGWICIAANMPVLVHCRFSYTKGGSPITDALGGPGVAGPNSFEVVAEGDKDGNGKFATFAILGDTESGGGGKALLSPVLEFDPLE